MADLGFEELERRDGRVVMCPRCGRKPVAGMVQIVVRRKTDGARQAMNKQIASTSLSMCEKCCVQVFTELEGSLYADVDEESRAAKAKALRESERG